MALLAAALLAGTLAMITPVPAVSAAPQVADDPGVIARWNAIALRTSLAQGAGAQYYLGVSSAAVYNAVVTIEGRFEPYLSQPPAKAHASPEAAAATAAYRVLVTMFPDQFAALTADYRASLALIPNGVGEVHGIRVGEQAAAAVLRDRAGDGHGSTTIPPLPVGDDPGEWRGTPPNPENAPMVLAWLGFTRPLLIESPTQFELDGPDPVGSAAYEADYEEVRADGQDTSATRTPAMTRTAVFFSDNSIRQYSDARAQLVIDHDMDIVESARMFAIFNMITTDSTIACWRAKYDYAFWRPVTAVRETDDPTWSPMLPTPMYPDYVSGHACITGPMSAGLDHLFPGGFDISLTTALPGASPTDPPTPTVRHYTSSEQLDEDTMNARIWLGFHFRKAMTDGNQLGHDVFGWAIDRYFQPVD